MNILFTGASRGIGAAAYALLKSRGHHVVGHSTRGTDDLIAGNLEDLAAPAVSWQAALERLGGRIDALVNNAGIYDTADETASDAEWHSAWARTMTINLQSAADLSRLAVRHFRERGGGRIVNIASRAAYRGDSSQHWHYAASKAGMIGMTKSIARGYAKEAILAFAVCPGFTMTGMADDYLASRGGDKLLADIPLGRVATPDEVASVAIYLALDAPASMTGAVLDVNGASFVR